MKGSLSIKEISSVTAATWNPFSPAAARPAWALWWCWGRWRGTRTGWPACRGWSCSLPSRHYYDLGCKTCRSKCDAYLQDWGLSEICFLPTPVWGWSRQNHWSKEQRKVLTSLQKKFSLNIKAKCTRNYSVHFPGLCLHCPYCHPGTVYFQSLILASPSNLIKQTSTTSHPVQARVENSEHFANISISTSSTLSCPLY